MPNKKRNSIRCPLALGPAHKERHYTIAQKITSEWRRTTVTARFIYPDLLVISTLVPFAFKKTAEANMGVEA